MIRRLYVIRDNVAEAAAAPIMTFPHDAVAVRSFSDIAADSNTNLARHIEDHDLVCVGEFDDELCRITNSDMRMVLTGKAWKAMQNLEEGLSLAK